MMMSRRDMLAGGMVGTAFGGSVDAAPAPMLEENPELVKGVREIAGELQNNRRYALPGELPAVVALRDVMLQFLKGTNKWPDFIDVGPAVWFRVYDWHVRFMIQPAVTRLPDGRYALTFMFTNLVLRPEQSRDYIGPAYEKER